MKKKMYMAFLFLYVFLSLCPLKALADGGEALETKQSAAAGGVFNGTEFLVELTVEYPEGYTGAKQGGLEEIRGGEVYERYTGEKQTIVGKNLFVWRAIHLEGMAAEIFFSTNGTQGGIGENTIYFLDGNGTIHIRYTWRRDDDIQATALGDINGMQMVIQYPEMYDGDAKGGLAILNERNQVIRVLDESGWIAAGEVAESCYGVPIYIEGLEGSVYSDSEAGVITVVYKNLSQKSPVPTTPAPGEVMEGPDIGNASHTASGESSGEDLLHTGPYTPAPWEPKEGPGASNDITKENMDAAEPSKETEDASLVPAVGARNLHLIAVIAAGAVILVTAVVTIILVKTKKK